MAANATELSRKFLQQVRKDGDCEATRKKICSLSREELEESLDTVDARKAFWLNFYNASAQSLLKEKRSRWRFKFVFYSRRYSCVAGKKLSLNKIEHGMLRNSKFSFAFGYVSKPAFGFERKYRVGETDPRIHFALNCGAKSCPPIGFYTEDGIDEELDVATRSYLDQEADYIEEGNTVLVPKMFRWFRGDFGGKEGIYDLLKRYEVIPQDSFPELDYRSYDWGIDLDNFRERE